MRFLYYYLRSMRLYYCFVTGSATLAGILLAHGMNHAPWRGVDFAILGIGFFAWGVNQIFNDAANLPEDRINAPHRPAVTGKLPLKPALILSSALMLIFCAVSFLISPRTLLPVLAGAALNLAYSPLKGVPVLGCFVYGGAIAMCAVYGWTAALGPDAGWRPFTELLPTFGLLCGIQALMCHNSYFKDSGGDRAVGKLTLQVLFPARVSLWITGTASLVFSLFFGGALILRGRIAEGILFSVFLIALSAGLVIQLADRRYHAATLLNCLQCVMFTLGFAVLRSPLWLAAAGGAFLTILLIYRWYPDEKE